MQFKHPWCAWLCIWYLQEVFDVRVVISFLLNQRGAVQLTRTKSAHRRKTFTKKKDGESSTDFRRRYVKPDVWLHVRQLIGQNVAYHLHWHPIT